MSGGEVGGGGVRGKCPPPIDRVPLHNPVWVMKKLRLHNPVWVMKKLRQNPDYLFIVRVDKEDDSSLSGWTMKGPHHSPGGHCRGFVIIRLFSSLSGGF